MSDDGSIDYTNRLGFLKMPPGYTLWWLDSGHFLYEREVDGGESEIHWNRFTVRRWAWADYRKRCETQALA